MLVNQNIIDNLINDAGQSRYEKAKRYVKQGRIELLDVEYKNDKNFDIRSIAIGTEAYKTYISIHNGEVEDITCDCQDYYSHYGVCKHTLASVIFFSEDERYNKKYGKNLKNKIDNINKYRNFKQIVNTFYNEEIDQIENDNEDSNFKNIGKIKLEPKILYDKFSGDMKVEFKIGDKKLYKLKDLSEFYIRMLNKEFYKYGEKLQFIHVKEMFGEDSKPLLDFILRYAEIIKYANSNSNSNYRYYGKALSETSIILGNSGIDEIFDILKGKSIDFQRDYNNEKIEFVEGNPKIEFKLKKINEEQYSIIPNIDIFNVTIIKGKNYKYILEKNKLYRCTRQFENNNLKLLDLFRQNYMTEVTFGKEELFELFSIVIPKVKDAIIIENVAEEEIEKYKPKNLSVKVYLDYDEKDFLIADVKFCYDENEFNPLNETEKVKFPRNKIEETKALNVFRKTGFMLDTQNFRFILPSDEKIYEFLTQDINYYMQKFEVLVTEKFKTKQIRQPKLGSLGVKVENNLLTIDLKNLDIDSKELEEVMNKYALKKKYHRLKDGSFINLEDNKEIDFLDKLATGMDIDYKEIENGEVRLPVQRSLYLNQLLKGIKSTEILKNTEYKEIVNNLDKDKLEEDIMVPENLNSVLRYYQKTGFKWLKVLDNYKFGGILADDMGLGKTIQMISVIVDYIQNQKNIKEDKENVQKGNEKARLNQRNIENKKRASIVVSPSSLTLNWQNEVNKFTGELKTLVIRGTLEERKRQIEKIENYDLVITSYDLLKRDIELYKNKNYQFRFIIADEAQYLKNSNTQNAKAIKQIKADTRYALTGTPIENSLAELWSIFDFIMPGYLFSYRKFKNMFETPIVKDNDEATMRKLKMLIEPFVLRRKKTEVLTELPDKTVTVLNNEMGEEQRKIYLNYLAQAKQELADEIEFNGYERSQIQILAALTRLRQICCHPGLFIEGYKDESSKLEQCIEILEEAVNSGHKILLFSGYTSMFELIEPKLKEKHIKYFKLTGSTKVDERIKLVDEFNENLDIKVFLISLKAGGTGLNLTGADMVIHYDPWWNLGAENQATDRAYRIGQKNNVQVYKLITKNSIEEKIYELQQKKADLADSMLNTNTSFVNRLSKDEIMELFS